MFLVVRPGAPFIASLFLVEERERKFLVTTSKELVTSSDALVTSSFPMRKNASPRGTKVSTEIFLTTAKSRCHATWCGAVYVGLTTGLLEG